ncbi:MAG TPA: MFS transporter [Verrucomicrobiae bacterium]|nr:MFS transporter [Verrucomicrobiae bacterium]
MAATAALATLDRGDRRSIAILSIAHLVNDSNQSALPAILPWLVAHRGLSLAGAATLVLAMNLSSSVIQPLFGHLSDRRSLAWVIPASIVLACLGTAVIGFSSSMPLMLAGAFVSGIGVAAFHPEGSRFANYFGGERRAAAMSWFTTGGYLGFALGPLLITPLLLAFGLPGAAWLLAPGCVIAAIIWRELPHYRQARERAHHAHRQRAGRDDWRAFGILGGMVALRSTAFFAAVTFMPIFAIDVLHVDKVMGSLALAAMLVTGAIGTIATGRLADRIDRRAVISGSLVCVVLFGAAIAMLGRYAPSYAALLPLAAAFGASLGASAGVLVVLGQEYLPQRIGIASGMTLGLSVTIGGLAAPLFGAIGDRYGLVAVFAALTLFAALALAVSLALPKPAPPPSP